MIKKLRRRFVIINMAIVTCMLLIIFSLVIVFTGINLRNTGNAMLQSLTSSAAKPGNPDPDIQLPYFTLRFTHRGDIWAIGKTNYDLSDEDFLNTLLSYISKKDAHNGYIAKYSLKYSLTPSQDGLTIVFLDISSQNGAMLSLIRVSCVIAILAFFIFMLISILLSRWTVNPVEKAWNQQKQFISDASHELKTPLTVIISNTELLQSADCDPDSQQHLSNHILTSSKQMQHLIEGMLELARADNGQIRTHFNTVDLSRVALECTLPFEPIFFENQLLLQSSLDPDIQLNGSEQYLRQLINILLDNAQKYSSPGLVKLELHRHSRNQCLLTLSNPGAPIPKEELEQIFDRFYRSDSARTNTGSFGLGLSIARRIAEEHGGKIWAESNATGNCFFVLLPCYTQ